MFKSVFDDVGTANKQDNFDRDSYNAHHAELSSNGKLEVERETHKKFLEEKLVDQPIAVLGDVLKGIAAQKNIEYAVDVGCGTGWATAILAKKMKHIWSIEPSHSGLEIAKTLYPGLSNIENVPGRHKGFWGIRK